MGLHAFFGIKKLPESSLYWSDDPWLGVPKVKIVMPRNRFDKLNQYLHLNNNSNALPRKDANYDKLFKVCPLLDAITKEAAHRYRNDTSDWLKFIGNCSFNAFFYIRRYTYVKKCIINICLNNELLMWSS